MNFVPAREVGMKLKHLAYHGGRKGTGSPGDNGLSNPIQQENVRLAITKALRLNYSISGSKNQPLFKKEQISLSEGTWILGLRFWTPSTTTPLRSLFNTSFFWHGYLG